MTRKPAYIVTGALSGLVGLAAVVVGGMLLYEYLVRLSATTREIEELFAGLAFVVGGTAVGLFTATTIRKFSSQRQESLLDAPEPETQHPTLTHFQKVVGIIGVQAGLALLGLAIWLFNDVYGRYEDTMRLADFPPKALITLAIMFVGAGCILYYCIGSFIIFRRRKPTPATT